MKNLLLSIICYHLITVPLFAQLGDTLKGTWQIANGATIKTANNIFIVTRNIDLNNNGTFLQGFGDGTMKLTGTSNTITSGTGATTLDQLEVAVDSGSSHKLESTVNVRNAITLASGQLVSNGFLVLKSDSLYTARVAPVLSTATPAIAGNVVTERYVSGRRKYRLLTSSVTTSPAATLNPGQEALSIWGNWQNQGDIINPNSGTIITGGAAADGFDQQTQNVSMFTYDEANRKYIAFSSALGRNTKYTPLKAGNAYYIFVYGDRTNSITTSSPKSTVIKQTGTLLFGDQTYNINSSKPLSNVVDRFTLLGNPYASPIDWAAVTKTNVADTYWGWDPNLGSIGGYIAVTMVGNSVVISPLTPASTLNQYIQPGQGFFVKTTAPSPSLVIKEEHKAGTVKNMFFRTIGSAGLPLIAVNLQYKSGANTIFADGSVAIFDPSFTDQTNKGDVGKMVGSAESVSMLKGTELMSIEGRPMPAAKDTLMVNMAMLTRPEYTLQIFTKNLPGSMTPYLVDRYLHTTQQLSTTDTNKVVVNITSNTASSDPKRFQIVFQTLSVLSVKITSLQAVKKDNDVLLDWKVADEAGLKKYEVERSINGIDFINLGEIAVGANRLNNVYQWTDLQPATVNYYRIRAVQNDLKDYYSKVVSVKMPFTKPTLKIFPNPIEDQKIQASIKGLEKGKYGVSVLSMKGEQLYTTSLQIAEGAQNHIIKLTSKLPAGTYLFYLSNNKIILRETIVVK